MGDKKQRYVLKYGFGFFIMGVGPEGRMRWLEKCLNRTAVPFVSDPVTFSWMILQCYQVVKQAAKI
jgi:hypothetical protein